MIDGINFGMLSPETIRKISVAKIVTPDTHDPDGYPIKGGLMDQRLGVIDPGLRCKTCRCRMGDCPGHFGHIELARPVIHVGYAKYIYMFLRSTCKKCGRVLIKPAEIEELKEAHLNLMDTDRVIETVQKASKDVHRCPHCGDLQTKIKLEKPTSYFEDKDRLTAVDIRERMERISDDDVKLFGLDPKVARPEWMVLTVLPIPPVTVRPSITLETGERSEDDLTHKLVDILRLNQRLAENIEAGAPQLILEDQWELVQYHVTTYLDNSVSGIPPARHRSGRPLKTLAQRLKGKEGRFRHSLAGKRVNFSARTVISPDPNIRIDEVGIPEIIARELTIPERVTVYNKKKLCESLSNGENYPGANYVIRDDGRRKRVTNENKDEVIQELQPGWIVERHLLEGDTVLFNRQPSLHRASIMAHKVRIFPDKTFRLNLCVCPPYNADFDGDEMNVHVPQTEEARAEAIMLMNVQSQIKSPRFGGPLIGCLHDHITGMYYLTKQDAYFTEQEAAQMLMAAGLDDVPKATKEGISGKALFSCLLPKDMNISFKSKFCKQCDECAKEKCKFDSYVQIRDGELISGIIDDKAIGAFSGKILEYLLAKKGPAVTADFLNRVTKLSIRALMLHGITNGLDEEDLPDDVLKQITELLKHAEEKVNETVEEFRHGTLHALPGRTLKETLEDRIMGIVNRARDKAGKLAEGYLKEDNQTAVMARTGARGNILNITQMSACLGQQAVRGQRIRRGYKNRTLPHFQPQDLGTIAHGFVRSSYKKGLSPVEFFFHAMGGRESLTDTAMRTPKSGYLQRRLINATQDLKLEYDNTVRDNSGRIIQFTYGEDGVDPSVSDNGKVDINTLVRE